MERDPLFRKKDEKIKACLCYSVTHKVNTLDFTRVVLVTTVSLLAFPNGSEISVAFV